MHLEVASLYKQFPTKRGTLLALKDINMHVETGELVCAVGASGSGKSTLLNILGILDEYDKGEYWLDGKLIKNITETLA